MTDTPMITRQPKPVSRKKEPLKGHEAFLKGLEEAQAIVEIMLMDDESFTGKIKHSDKYTVTISVDKLDGGYQNFVIFKHAIKYFWTNPSLTK